MKIAICDTESFYPLRNLVSGPLRSLDDLAKVERFIRTVLLHDHMVMELTPWPYVPENDLGFTDEEKRAGARLVITAIGPTLTGYDFFTQRTDLRDVQIPDISLSAPLISIAADFSNATEGNPFYKSHVEYIKTVLGVVDHGGSALLSSDFGKTVIARAEKYPDSLFQPLDKDWQEFADSAQRDRLGLLVPPVLGVILRRCAKRDDIPTAIRTLRDEWADARRKVWQSLDALKECRTIGEANAIHRELSEASKYFSPKQKEIDSRPIRIFWEITAATAGGAAIASLSGGNAAMGAAAGAITQAARSLPGSIHEIGAALFGRGAFDLANTIRRETAKVELSILPQLLTDVENQKLGLR